MKISNEKEIPLRKIKNLLSFVYDEISVNPEYRQYHPDFPLETNMVVRNILLNNEVLVLANDDIVYLKQDMCLESIFEKHPEHRADEKILHMIEAFIRYDKEV